MIELLRTGSAEANKTKAAGALRSLASADADNKKLIAQAGGIGPLIELLRTGSAEAKTNAAVALYNLTSTEELRKQIEAKGFTRAQLDSLSS